MTTIGPLAPHVNTTAWPCLDANTFFSSRASKNLGYIPLVGTVVGIGRIFFAAYQYSQGAVGWNKDRLIEQVSTGVVEALSLGPLLLLYDLFFVKSAPSVPQSPGTSQSLAISDVPLFSRFESSNFSDHAARLVALYANKQPTATLRQSYEVYTSSGRHAWRAQRIFQGADFYTRHGIAHASFVAHFVPVFIALYQNAGHPEAASLSREDILGLQAVAFLHDYGRVSTGSDLCSDREELERIGQATAYRYLRDAMGFSEERAQRLSQYILTKDSPLAGKSLLCQILQNCDCLAVLRADDWEFDPRYLDLMQWIQSSISTGAAQERAKEELHTVIDSAKRLLVEMGDSPYSMPCFSRASAGQVIQGNFSLPTKRAHERNPQVYGTMLQLMQSQPVLRDLLIRSV